MSRSLADIEHHYRVELELAGRLRTAPRSNRLNLYGEVYDELFRRVPNHPQLVRKQSAAEKTAELNERLALLRRFIHPDTVFLEIGAGDCMLTREVARHAAKCYALDVSREILRGVEDPKVETVLSDGCSIPVPPQSITLAFSYQVMEHIHPDDAVEQLRNIVAALAPGGSYLCVTPSPLNGPHDVSKFFDRVARGFHLKEYTASDLKRLFHEVGFTRVEAYLRVGGRYIRLPMAPVTAFEWLYARLPWKVRKRFGRTPGVHSMLTVTLRAIK
jgi:SAM-dependent methyltransferase